MANSEAGERIGRAGRQREYIKGELWKKEQDRTRRGGCQGPATQPHRVRVKVTYTEVRER